MSEAEFQARVIRLARLLGWRVYHTHDSRRSAAGFPDLVLARRGRGVIYAELKSEKGRTTAEQDEWLGLLRDSGQDVFLWRPADLQTIADILGGTS